MATLLLFLPLSVLQAEEAVGFEQGLQTLNVNSFTQKQQAIETFAQIPDERVAEVLQAMSDGELYYRKSDALIVHLYKESDTYHAYDYLTARKLADINKREYKKIRVNNRLRIQLRRLLADMNLDSKQAEVRLAAVEDMIKKLQPEYAVRLNQRLQVEKDEAVTGALLTALALIDLSQPETEKQLAAIHTLQGSLYPEVRVALEAIINRNNDAQVVTAAKKSRTFIQERLELMATAETVFFGLSLGSVLLLSAIGLAITFGVMGVINMAHGELMMLGAYTTFIVQQLMPGAIDYSLYVAIPAAFIVSGLFGIAIERGVIRHLYGRPLETLLATFGVSLVLQQLVRTTISAQNVAVSNPSWMSGSLQLGQALSLTYNRLYILVFALLVFALLLFILKKTSLGLQVRAVTQNRQMARAMGIRSAWVDAMTFGLGSGIAGVAGVALSQLTNVGPNMGQAYIIDSFMVVVFGGVGNLWGTLVGAFSLGVANKVLEPWAGAVLAKILVLVFIILFIQKRPRGLFPQKGRAAEN